MDPELIQGTLHMRREYNLDGWDACLSPHTHLCYVTALFKMIFVVIKPGLDRALTNRVGQEAVWGGNITHTHTYTVYIYIIYHRSVA